MMQSSPLFSSAEFSTNTVRATSTVTATIQKQLNVYENLDNCLGYYSTSKVVQRILHTKEAMWNMKIGAKDLQRTPT